MEALHKAIDLIGSQAELARRLGVSAQVVHNWKIRGSVPAEYVPAIEMATAGGVRAEEIRPDIPWHVLRSKRCKAA